MRERYILWGYEGQSRGNENAVLLRNPILMSADLTEPEERLLLVRRYPFGDPDSFFHLGHVDAAHTYGERLASREQPIEVNSTQRVGVLGRAYARALATVATGQLDGWMVAPETPVHFALMDPTEFRRFCEANADSVRQELLKVLAEMDPEVPQAHGAELLQVLDVNPVVERLEYYALAMAYQLRAGESQDWPNRFTRLAERSTGKSLQSLVALASELIPGAVLPWTASKSSSIRAIDRRDLAWVGARRARNAEFAHAMFAADAASAPLQIDLARDMYRIKNADVFQTLLFTNLLLGKYKGLELDVSLPPDDDSYVLNLRRGGLHAALARTRWRVKGADAVVAPIQPYHPSNPQFRLKVISKTQRVATVADDLMTIVDPHLRPIEELPLLYKEFLKPWLDDRLALAPSAQRAAIAPTVSAIGKITVELLENVRLHACLNQYDTVDTSMLQLYVTRGAVNRLYAWVMDNGAGFVTTIRKRFPWIKSGEEALGSALLGSLPREGRRRRYGIPHIRSLCDEYVYLDSELLPRLTIVCAHSDRPDSGLVLQYRPDQGLGVESLERVPLEGTVVMVDLPLALRSFNRRRRPNHIHAHQLRMEMS